MESLHKIFDRFMRQLPFLAAPGSYRRFHCELLYPYPDVWNGPDTVPSIFAAPSTAASARPEIFSSAGARRASMPRHPVGHQVRPYLRSTDMDSVNDHRGEPFW